MWISRGMIRLSMSLEKSSRSLTLSSILALPITRSGWQFAWVRCCTVLALKLAVIVNYFTTERFSWMCIVLVLTTIVIHSWAYDNSSLARDAPFSNTTSTRSVQSERDSGSTQPIFKIKTDSVREKVHLSSQFYICVYISFTFSVVVLDRSTAS